MIVKRQKYGVDTTAAGDTFTARELVIALNEGKSIEEAIEFGQSELQ